MKNKKRATNCILEVSSNYWAALCITQKWYSPGIPRHNSLLTLSMNHNQPERRRSISFSDVCKKLCECALRERRRGQDAFEITEGGSDTGNQYIVGDVRDIRETMHHNVACKNVRMHASACLRSRRASDILQCVVCELSEDAQEVIENAVHPAQSTTPQSIAKSSRYLKRV